MTGDRRSAWRGHPLRDPSELVLEEIQRARRALKSPGDVHEARRALKRARALLRLLQTGTRKDTARRIRHALRQTGRHLSETRDREVAAEVAREMERDFGSPRSLADELEEQRQRSQEALDAGLGRSCREELAVARKEIPALQRSVPPAEAVAEVARAYRRARVAFQKARGRPSIYRMHTLRKRVKDFRYQMEWVVPLWSTVLGGWARELHDLTDDLGRLQDIRVLRVAGHALEDPGNRRRLAWALRGLRREMRRTRRRAFGRCAKLLVEDPDAFGARLGALAAPR